LLEPEESHISKQNEELANIVVTANKREALKDLSKKIFRHCASSSITFQGRKCIGEKEIFKPRQILK